jgi:large subunit ribosomal protein L31e
MSEEERVYTINLSKVILTPRSRRSKRAVNMIREFAMKHMKSEEVKIDEELNQIVWERGIRRPPRKIRVKIARDPDGIVRVKPYSEGQEESKVEAKVEENKTEEKVEEQEKASV